MAALLAGGSARASEPDTAFVGPLAGDLELHSDAFAFAFSREPAATEWLSARLLGADELDVTPPRGVRLVVTQSSRMRFLLRPGYAEGVPIPEDVVRLDDFMRFQSSGRVLIGAGNLTWLHVEVDTFRQATGARRYNFVALPGLVVRPFGALPVQCGVSMLFAVKKAPDAYSDELRRALGFVQLSGRF